MDTLEDMVEQYNRCCEQGHIDTESYHKFYSFEGSTRGKRHVIAKQVQTPHWARNEKEYALMDMAYRWAKKLTEKTGKQWNVDHDIPLRGDFVSGLHVFDNLRVMTLEENSRKGGQFVVA